MRCHLWCEVPPFIQIAHELIGCGKEHVYVTSSSVILTQLYCMDTPSFTHHIHLLQSLRHNIPFTQHAPHHLLCMLEARKFLNTLLSHRDPNAASYNCDSWTGSLVGYNSYCMMHNTKDAYCGINSKLEYL
jgi:hypothetical protein